jgi:hypothetical protein
MTVSAGVNSEGGRDEALRADARREFLQSINVEWVVLPRVKVGGDENGSSRG